MFSFAAVFIYLFNNLSYIKLYAFIFFLIFLPVFDRSILFIFFKSLNLLIY